MFYVDLYNLCIYCLIEMRFKTRRYVYLQSDFDIRFLKISPSLINFSGRYGRHLEHCTIDILHLLPSGKGWTITQSTRIRTIMGKESL